jgi:hypothetical protein
VTLATWLAIAVLGPGAILLLAWFLFDLRKLVARRPRAANREAGDRDAGTRGMIE